MHATVPGFVHGCWRSELRSWKALYQPNHLSSPSLKFIFCFVFLSWDKKSQQKDLKLSSASLQYLAVGEKSLWACTESQGKLPRWSVSKREARSSWHHNQSSNSSGKGQRTQNQVKEMKCAVEKEAATETECLSFSATEHWFWFGLAYLSKELQEACLKCL